MSRADDVLAALELAAGSPPARWLRESRPFLAFAEAHAGKIRRKVRQARTPDEAADLLGELAVARAFLLDPRCAVSYEPLKAGGGRTPDLRVTFRVNTALNVEVTRQRPRPDADAQARLARLLLDKAGQLQPAEANLLVVLHPPEVHPGVPEALRRIEQSPPSPERAAFLRAQPRLSAVAPALLTAAGELEVDGLWLNPQARAPLPPALSRLVAGWVKASG